MVLQDVSTGLTDDFEVADDGVLGDRRLQKSVEDHISRIAADTLDGIENVREIRVDTSGVLRVRLKSGPHAL